MTDFNIPLYDTTFRRKCSLNIGPVQFQSFKKIKSSLRSKKWEYTLYVLYVLI